MSVVVDTPLQRGIQLLLSPLEEQFQRYLDICDDLHQCDAAGNSLLHWAAAIGNFSAAYSLLQRGLDVDGRNAQGATPLLVAAALCPTVATMGYLLVCCGALLDAAVEATKSSVESLLTARQLGHVWRWLVAYKRTVGQADDPCSGLSSFQGQRAWPSVHASSSSSGTTGVATGDMPALLCSPTQLKRLLAAGSKDDPYYSPNPMQFAAVSVPRPPPRRPPLSQPQLQEQPVALSNGTSSAVSVSNTAVLDDVHTLSAQSWRMRVQLLSALEEAARLQIERDQVESFLHLYADTVSFSYGYYEEESSRVSFPERIEVQSPVKPVRRARGSEPRIRAVLGERMDAGGRRHLLVQYDTSHAVQGSCEEWRLAESVMQDPVVRAHLERTYSATTLADVSELRTPSIMTLRNAGSPLETWEREQLEAQLRLLPRRALYSREGGSPNYSQPIPTFLMSPTEKSPNRDSVPLITDFMWQERSPKGGRGGHAPLRAHPSLSSGSVVQEHASLSADNERSSWRFAPGSVRRSDAAGGAAVAEHSPPPENAARQLLLSAGRQRRVIAAEAAREDETTAWEPPPQLPPVQQATLASILSTDTTLCHSPGLSSAPTKAPTTYNASATDVPSTKENNRVLTASQKSEYNHYLYGAALRVLQQKQRQGAPRST